MDKRRSGKERLDALLLKRGLAASRSQAAAMIMAAEVFVNGRIIDKPGAQAPSDADIKLKEKPRYVGRGGLKLEAALAVFDADPLGKVCADVGASTGGFTDCLLQHGAARVWAIDVGAGLMDYRLRMDERVVLLENTNARYLNALEEPVAIAVIDVSFISLRLILPAVKKWLTDPADVVALVKPQFEAGRADVGKGGVVRNRDVHRRVLAEMAQFAESIGFAVADIIASPIRGQKGNIEYLMWLTIGDKSAVFASYRDKIALAVAAWP